MNLRSASTQRVLILLTCAGCLLFCISAGTIGVNEPAAASAFARVQPLAAAPQTSEYEVVLLFGSGGLTDTSGQGVGGGQAVGTGRIAGALSPDQTHAVLWPQGSSVGIDLNPLDFRYSATLDTDGQQQVGHGNGTPTGFQRHALLWSGSSTGYIDLHPGSNWTDSIATSIAGNQQVGNINFYYQGNESSPLSRVHAALWRGSAASVVDLHPNGIGCQRSYANATDGNRQVGYGYFDNTGTNAPYRALLWSGTASTVVILHPSGFSHSFAEGISGNEQVGYALNTQGDGYGRAILWHGTVTSAVVLHPAAYLASTALATNGMIQVGFGGGPTTNYQSHAVRWSGSAESLLDLHALLPPEFRQGSSIAYDIDAIGNITGLAQRPDGSTIGVLWRRTGGTPTPTPTPMATPTPTPTPTPNPPPNALPQVQINSPTSGQVLSDRNPIQLIATASDADGSVRRVDFYANDRLVGTATTGAQNGSYRYSWRVSVRHRSEYRLQAQAIDNRGAMAFSRSITITVTP